MRNLLVLAVGLALVGCSGVLNPDGRLSFSATRPAMGGGPQFARVTDVSQSQVRFAGSITTPSPCFGIRGTANVTEDAITITVSAVSTLRSNETCATVVAESEYEGTLRELAPRSYRVIVIHTIANTGWPVQTVADTAIVVP